jgi:ABC-type Na+ efflux pump permease subunit
MNFKIKFRFLKYAFITIGITIFVFSILLLLGLDFLIPFGFMISIKYITQILESYTDRKNTYIRLYNQFNKNPNDIKKSILYRMWPALCEREVAKQLARDFNLNL